MSLHLKNTIHLTAPDKDIDLESMLTTSNLEERLILALSESDLNYTLDDLVDRFTSLSPDTANGFVQKLHQKSPQPKHTPHIVKALMCYIQKKQSENSQVGEKEQQLMTKLSKKLMHQLDPNDTTISQKAVTKAQNQWLDKPQQQLNHQTPREVILTERQQLGNPEKRIGLTLQRYQDPSSKTIDIANHATDMTRQGKYYKALKEYNKIIPLPQNTVEEPFRIYNNIASCIINLGLTEPGGKYIKSLRRQYPQYKILKKNLKAVNNKHNLHHFIIRGIPKILHHILKQNIQLNHLNKPPEMLQDLNQFLHIISQTSPPITLKKHHLNKKTVFLLNLQQTQPESEVNITHKKDQSDFFKINFLHHLVVRANWAKHQNNKLVISPKGKTLLKTPTHQQLIQLIKIWWQPKHWPAVYHRHGSLSELQQASASATHQLIWPVLFGLYHQRLRKKVNYMKLFAEIYQPKLDEDKVSQEQFMAAGTFTLIISEQTIIKPFVWLGLLETNGSLEETLDSKSISPDKITIRLTTLGRQLVSTILATAPQIIPPNIQKLIAHT